MDLIPTGRYKRVIRPDSTGMHTHCEVCGKTTPYCYASWIQFEYQDASFPEKLTYADAAGTYGHKDCLVANYSEHALRMMQEEEDAVSAPADNAS